ncbi:MAG: hypothetical protein OXH31_10255 [Gammaproteobacteria bacterium]|nr:hypothetical protein [Gammaproteobacteria bacterium]
MKPLAAFECLIKLSDKGARLTLRGFRLRGPKNAVYFLEVFTPERDTNRLPEGPNSLNHAITIHGTINA